MGTARGLLVWRAFDLGRPRMASMDPLRPRYSRGQRTLHWLIFACVLLAYAFINIKDWLPRDARAQMLEAHFAAGLAVLLLIWPRLMLRLRRGAPAITPALPRHLHVPGQITHALLYAFLIVQPLLGLAAVELGGHAVNLPFGLAIPLLIRPDHLALARGIKEIHVDLGYIFYWVIGMHIAAALWHHAFRGDDTLKRMV